ncbi:FAD dependent monooxygenase [Microdochium nivale]|nr:FAD dependent monooxygenase [Microdochium nivale]
MERRFLLQSIFNQIRDETKVSARTKLASFTEHPDRVDVVTDSGETITGHVLVGADCVHSVVRRHMADQLATFDPATSRAMQSSFRSQYHCIFATSHNARADGGKPFLPDAMVHNVYYPGISGVSAAGVSGLVFWFIFVRTGETKTTAETAAAPRFTDQDAEDRIAKYGDYQLGPDYTFRDLWDARIKAAMVPLEEGVLGTRWNSGGRVVLVGDSVHKATINAGLGGNLAIEGVVNLVNPLVAALRKPLRAGRDKAEGLSRGELHDVFAAYEREQRPRAGRIVALSGYITRFEAMETWWLRLLRWVVPWVSDAAKASGMVSYIKQAKRLDFLPEPTGDM